MESEQEENLRQQLVIHLQGGEAFMPVTELLLKIPFSKIGEVPQGLPYSFYQLFWHMRLAQQDILEFSRSADYQSPSWPDGYWTVSKAPETEAEWQGLITAYLQEREAFCALIQDPANKLFQPFNHGTGQTLFREAQLIIEHTAYHTGQLLVILRLLGLHQ